MLGAPKCKNFVPSTGCFPVISRACITTRAPWQLQIAMRLFSGWFWTSRWLYKEMDWWVQNLNHSNLMRLCYLWIKLYIFLARCLEEAKGWIWGCHGGQLQATHGQHQRRLPLHGLRWRVRRSSLCCEVGWISWKFCKFPLRYTKPHSPSRAHRCGLTVL